MKIAFGLGSRKSRSRRGAAMIIALGLVLCLTVLIAGTQLVVVQQLAQSRTERDYERALMMAEAGENTYVNFIIYGAASGTNASYIPPSYNFATSTLGVAPTIAQFRTGVLNGTYSLIRYPAGSQQGYFVGQTTNVNGTILVTSYGWSNGVVRRASVTASPSPVSGGLGYALFSGGVSVFNGANFVQGSIGSNSTIGLLGANTITGKVVFNGLTSGWSAIPAVGNMFASVVSNTQAVPWPTVESLANQGFPLGGLTYLAANNDNLLSGIAGTSLNVTQPTFTFSSKAGGANYYLTSLTCAAGCNLFLDNSLGPITIWVGPSGGLGLVNLNGVSCALSAAGHPANACRLYDATIGSIALGGGSNVNLGIYNVNNAGIGAVTLANTGMINGSIIADSLVAIGSNTVTYSPNYFSTPGIGTPYTSTAWTELE